MSLLSDLKTALDKCTIERFASWPLSSLYAPSALHMLPVAVFLCKHHLWVGHLLKESVPSQIAAPDVSGEKVLARAAFFPADTGLYPWMVIVRRERWEGPLAWTCVARMYGVELK